MTSGIYSIVNKMNNKRYVGSAKNINSRIRDHKSGLIKNIHRNIYLQRSWNKYGIDAFSFEILEVCLLDRLLEREQYWIDFHKAYIFKYGYNRSPTAGNVLGIKFSEDSKRKRSIALKKYYELNKKIILPETRYKISNTLKGRKLSEQTKEKMRKALASNEARERLRTTQRRIHLGRKCTEQQKENIRNGTCGVKKIHYKNKELWIKNMANGHRGLKRTDETKRKMSQSQKGKKRTEETKKNLSKAWSYEKHFTQVTKTKLSDATKLNWIKKKNKKWINCLLNHNMSEILNIVNY